MNAHVEEAVAAVAEELKKTEPTEAVKLPRTLTLHWRIEKGVAKTIPAVDNIDIVQGFLIIHLINGSIIAIRADRLNSFTLE